MKRMMKIGHACNDKSHHGKNICRKCNWIDLRNCDIRKLMLRKAQTSLAIALVNCLLSRHFIIPKNMHPGSIDTFRVRPRTTLKALRRPSATEKEYYLRPGDYETLRILPIARPYPVILGNRKGKPSPLKRNPGRVLAHRSDRGR